MSRSIFISYRRDDASYAAGRLYDRLAAHFLENQIFMDVDNLNPGVDFITTIDQSLDSCDVLIAVIGKRWLDASDEYGRRLDDPQDPVRTAEDYANAIPLGLHYSLRVVSKGCCGWLHGRRECTFGATFIRREIEKRHNFRQQGTCGW